MGEAGCMNESPIHLHTTIRYDVFILIIYQHRPGFIVCLGLTVSINRARVVEVERMGPDQDQTNI